MKGSRSDRRLAISICVVIVMVAILGNTVGYVLAYRLLREPMLYLPICIFYSLATQTFQGVFLFLTNAVYRRYRAINDLVW